MKMKNGGLGLAVFGCGVYSLILFLILWLLSFCFEYSLYIIIGKDIPWYADLIGGIVLNACIVSVAFICWVIELCGATTPLF